MRPERMRPAVSMAWHRLQVTRAPTDGGHWAGIDPARAILKRPPVAQMPAITVVSHQTHIM
jgi:hypothetical protein